MKLSIGIDLGGTNIKFGLVTVQGKIIYRRNILTQAEQGPELTITRMINCLKELKQLFARDKIRQIGIGCAGLIDHKKGIVHFSPNLPNWQDIPLKTWLENELKIPVFVGNDANAFVLGEYCFGAGRKSDNLFAITLGTGVGGGMVLHGKLWLGWNQAAGEIGHTTINPKGPKCKCGNHGCLERYVGASYIVARTISKLKSKKSTKSSYLSQFRTQPALITPKIICWAAKQGDQLAKAIVEETGHYLGIGVANIISLLDPAVIIIGGGVSGFGKLLLDAVRATVKRRIMNFSGRRVKIVLAKLKDSAAILGASQFDKFLL